MLPNYLVQSFILFNLQVAHAAVQCADVLADRSRPES